MAKKVAVKAASVAGKSVKPAKKTQLVSPFAIYWTKVNYSLLALGILLCVIGFYMMSVKPWDSTVALVFSPIVLALAYFVVFPLAIFLKKKKAPESSAQE